MPFNKHILEELQAFNDKKSKKKGSELTEIQQGVLDQLKNGMNVPQIAIARGRAKDVIWKSIKLIKKKGYSIKPVYKGVKVTHYEVLDPDTKK